MKPFGGTLGLGGDERAHLNPPSAIGNEEDNNAPWLPSCGTHRVAAKRANRANRGRSKIPMY
jgi:hypothetical protein